LGGFKVEVHKLLHGITIDYTIFKEKFHSNSSIPRQEHIFNCSLSHFVLFGCAKIGLSLGEGAALFKIFTFSRLLG